MNDTSPSVIREKIETMRSFFSSRQTIPVPFRKEYLKKFRKSIQAYERRLSDALWTDLRKSPEETYLTEIGMVLQEIDLHLSKLESWSAPATVHTPLYLAPSSGRIIYEPLGVSLIIAPWNYPFQLLMNPLIGAISAGCCALLKPSPYTPSVALVMEELIKEVFPPGYVTTVTGGRHTNEELLRHRFDVIFFTGSPSLGKVVMKAASDHLTPLILELGGKSPCVVDKGANLRIAAKRIAWGKTINAGQTCIAPDYLFVHASVKNSLISELRDAITTMYGTDIKRSRFFPRIVNDQAFVRLQNLMSHGTVVFGGETDRAERYIAPTLIDGVEYDYPVMQEEIFGPVLPILTFHEIEEVLNYINSCEKPLALYYFGKENIAKKVFSQTSSGGGCINDTIMHIVNHNLPFGGVGNSGMGKYHGLESFLAFSNRRSVVRTPTLFDLPFRYVPFNFFSLLKKIL